MFRHAWILPVISFLVNIIGIFIVYVMAVARGDVEAFWPYISTAGALPPESCVFGLVLNIGTTFLVASVYIRHRMIISFYKHVHAHAGSCWINMSRVLLTCGFISGFGLLLVANFQEVNNLTVHMFGALMAFVIGLVYAWGQTVFGYVMKPRMSSLCLLHTRLVICIVGLVAFIIMEVTGFSAPRPKTYILPSGNSTQMPFGHWPDGVPGYAEHIASTMCEWIMVLMFEVFMLTYVAEFRHADVIPVHVLLPVSRIPSPAAGEKPIKVTYRSNSVMPVAMSNVKGAHVNGAHYVVN